MDPKRPPSSDKNGPDGKRPKSHWLFALVIAVAVALIFSFVYNAIADSKYTETTYNDFLKAMNSNNLSEVELQYDSIIYMTKEEAAKPASQQKACYTGLPNGGDTMELAEKLDGMGVKVKRQIVEDNSTIIMLLTYALMIGGMFLLMSMITRRMGGDGALGGFGKNNAKAYER